MTWICCCGTRCGTALRRRRPEPDCSTGCTPARGCCGTGAEPQWPGQERRRSSWRRDGAGRVRPDERRQTRVRVGSRRAGGRLRRVEAFAVSRAQRHSGDVDGRAGAGRRHGAGVPVHAADRGGSRPRPGAGDGRRDGVPQAPSERGRAVARGARAAPTDSRGAGADGAEDGDPDAGTRRRWPAANRHARIRTPSTTLSWREPSGPDVDPRATSSPTLMVAYANGLRAGQRRGEPCRSRSNCCRRAWNWTTSARPTWCSALPGQHAGRELGGPARGAAQRRRRRGRGTGRCGSAGGRPRSSCRTAGGR